MREPLPIDEPFGLRVGPYQRCWKEIHNHSTCGLQRPIVKWNPDSRVCANFLAHIR